MAAGEVGEGVIRPLRRAHFRIWVVLAVLLPAVLAAAMAARRDATARNPQLLWEQYR